jgi:hypothetical protein
LINEILDLALIESGKLSLSMEPVSLTEVMYECEAMVEAAGAEARHQRGLFRFEAPYFVNADRTRVKQVLINLLSNAIKYNRVGGTVTVECTPSSRRIRCASAFVIPARDSPRPAGAALPALQSSRTKGQHRGRHRHRPGGVQAAGRIDGRRDRRRKHGRARAACSGSNSI